MQEIVLISIPESTLISIVEEAVKNAIGKLEPKGEPQKKVVDLNGLLEARPEIGKRSTVYKKISLGQIPHSKNGKKLYFDLAKIDEWLMSNSNKKAKEVEQEVQKYLNKRRK